MEPITFSIVSGLLFLAYDKYKKNKSARPAAAQVGAQPGQPSAQVGGALPTAELERFMLPFIGGPEVEAFTHVVGGLRHFDRKVAHDLPGMTGGLPFFLSARSAFPISSGPLAQAAPSARVFRVMPLAPGAVRASDILEQAHLAGQTVLGTLTLIGLGWNSPAPMLLIVGGAELRPFVAAAPGQRGDFAIIPPPVPVVQPVETAAPVAAPAAAVGASPAAIKVKVKAPAASPPPVEEGASEGAPADAPAIEVKSEVVSAPRAKAQKPNGKKDEPEAPAVIVTEGEVKA